MLKHIFDEDVDFFSKKNNFVRQRCLSTLNLINQRNVSHIKLSKYCNIDARLRLLYSFMFALLQVKKV